MHLFLTRLIIAKMSNKNQKETISFGKSRGRKRGQNEEKKARKEFDCL